MILEFFHHSYINNFSGANTDLNRQDICIYSRILSSFHHFISACKMSWKRPVVFNHYGSPPGSPVPEILQAGTLEWVAIFFSNA